MELDFQLIRECLHFSVRVYDECSIEEPGTSTEVLIGGSLDDPGTIIVAFRGTEQPRDYLTDARFLVKNQWPCEGNGGARVHRGFCGSYFSVSEKIHARVQGANRIILTGHSLGGALATLAALDLFENGLPVVNVVTFGSPRVGNGAFRDFYDTALGGKTLRLVAQGDPVTFMPPWLNGFRHVGTEVYLPDAGGYTIEPSLASKVIPFCQALLNLRDDPTELLGLFDPHLLRNYAKLIGQLA